jgi:hypothetical protein
VAVICELRLPERNGRQVKPLLSRVRCGPLLSPRARSFDESPALLPLGPLQNSAAPPAQEQPTSGISRRSITQPASNTLKLEIAETNRPPTLAGTASDRSAFSCAIPVSRRALPRPPKNLERASLDFPPRAEEREPQVTAKSADMVSEKGAAAFGVNPGSVLVSPPPMTARENRAQPPEFRIDWPRTDRALPASRLTMRSRPISYAEPFPDFEKVR